ncbi:glycerate kinase [uncultured Shewanella sp.]|uniref:glycerate kinase n=1 Tax=uncultured Shewanella sp. TaxID=173975 RepID=UPI0026067322|nr:glycerate kinase [uncultured Shewanella sp.]
MKIVIAPDSFKESLTAVEVANEIEKGFKSVFPHAHYINQPIADGGEGTVDTLIASTKGEKITLTVTNPLGDAVQAYYGILGHSSASKVKTAVIEVAKASGLDLIPNTLRDPQITSSIGTGELILDALNRGIKHIILGLGGSATNDAGAGILSALGVRFLDKNKQRLKPGGIHLQALDSIDTTQIHPLVQTCQFELACDVTNPLCGPTGASQIFGPQKGANSHTVNRLDKALAHFADVWVKTGKEDHRDKAGVGAAGGIGFGLMSLLQATIQPGIDLVIETTGLDKKIIGADLVITGEGCLDSQTLNGKAPIGVARLANQHHIPVIAIGGCISKDAQVLLDNGITALFSITPKNLPLTTLFKQARPHLFDCSRNIAALYNIAPKSQ